jgi:spore maturation protein CgeB
VDVMVVGNAGGTNVGASLQRAAIALGLNAGLCDSGSASAGNRIASILSWRMFDHRPLHLDSFSRAVVAECRRRKPGVLITTGLAPVTAGNLAEIGKMGVFRINYSTDDPWNPAFRSKWFSDALRTYDSVFTVRRSNCSDLRRHGCKQVSYLPFGYDESLWIAPGQSPAPAPYNADIFFAGAAEKFRAECIRELAAAGYRIALAGDYWRRIPDLRKWSVGHFSAAQLHSWTRAIPVSLCLVRRANRDGHVMRSFEIPAIGACMLVEDTEEHRETFGEDGAAVRYFRSPQEAAAVAKQLLRDEAQRYRLAAAAHARICGAPNTYRDRLITMIEKAAPAISAAGSFGGHAATGRVI